MRAEKPVWQDSVEPVTAWPRSPLASPGCPPQYQRALDIFERLGNQAGMAASYHNLGRLAQDRGDYDEAARQYQRALDINERLGNQAGMATSYSQLGILEMEHGGSIAAAVTWHVRALAIRLPLGVPQAGIDLRRLAAHRRLLGAEPFTRLLTQAASSTGLADAITSLLDQVDNSDVNTGRLSEVTAHYL
jgi:tetratricopeptide (TPR) repeat protein